MNESEPEKDNDDEGPILLNENFPRETIEQFSKDHFKKEKTKFTQESLHLTAEMLRIYILEIAQRSAESAAFDGKEEVTMDHFKRVLPQFLLDFA